MSNRPSQSAILITEEAVRQRQHDEPIGESAACIGQPWQLIRDNQKTNLQPPGPVREVLAIYRDRVLAADGQQPLGDGVLIGAATEPSIAYNCETLSDQRCQAEIGAEPGERRSIRVVGADQGRDHARDRALTGSRRSDEQEKFLVARISGQREAEDFLQRLD